jgi:hypothetical protein
MTAVLVFLLLAATAQQHEGPSSNLVTHSAVHTIKRLIQVRQNSENYRIDSLNRTLSTDSKRQKYGARLNADATGSRRSPSILAVIIIILKTKNSISHH